MLATQNLIVGWESRKVLDLGSVTFSAGEIVVIAGPNGCGKSTALKTLARQIPLLGGAVTIDGAPIWSLDSRQFAAQVSYVPQLIEPPREMLVEELIALGRNPHQSWWSWQTSSNDLKAIEMAIEQTSVSSLRKKRVVDLSGGERQRTVIASALAQEASIMLLDEPTAHLDFKHQLGLVELLQGLRNRGIGIVIVLHDLNLMARVADRVILLRTNADHPSSIAAIGTPEEVLTPSILRTVYEVEVSIVTDPQNGLKIYSPITTAESMPPQN